MAKNRDVALEHLTHVVEVGNWNEYESSLETALALGLEEHVDAIQERWEVAKAEVSGWLGHVASSWGVGSWIVSKKVKEARRLGLMALAEEVQATILEKENNVLVGLVMFPILHFDKLTMLFNCNFCICAYFKVIIRHDSSSIASDFLVLAFIIVPYFSFPSFWFPCYFL